MSNVKYNYFLMVYDTKLDVGTTAKETVAFLFGEDAAEYFEEKALEHAHSDAKIFNRRLTEKQIEGVWEKSYMLEIPEGLWRKDIYSKAYAPNNKGELVDITARIKGGLTRKPSLTACKKKGLTVSVPTVTSIICDM